MPSNDVTNYAKRCFLDRADHDYIAARTLVRHHCVDQALISMQQAIEKYLKAILLYHRVSSKDCGHNLERLLDRCQRNISGFTLSEDSVRFIRELNGIEFSRYLTYSYYGVYQWFIILDKTVWQLRIFTRQNYAVIIANGLDELIGVDFVSNGELEKILSLRGNIRGIRTLRGNLVWKNLYYSGRRRRNVLRNVAFGSWSSTSPFDLGDNRRKKLLYDELKDLIYIPKALKMELERL